MKPEISLDNPPTPEEKRQNFQTIKERFIDKDQQIYTVVTLVDENENPITMTIRDSADEVLQFIDYAKCKELNPDFEVFKSKIIKHLLNADLIPKKDND